MVNFQLLKAVKVAKLFFFFFLSLLQSPQSHPHRPLLETTVLICDFYCYLPAHNIRSCLTSGECRRTYHYQLQASPCSRRSSLDYCTETCVVEQNCVHMYRSTTMVSTTWTTGSYRLMHDQTTQHHQSGSPVSKEHGQQEGDNS